MENDAPVIYGLEFQGRTLAARAAETDEIHFLVGTQSLKAENQIHLLQFDDESNYVEKVVFLHSKGEVWSMSTSPADKNVLATCHSGVSGSKIDFGATIWRIPTDEDAGYIGSPTPYSKTSKSRLQSISSTAGAYLQELCILPDHQGQVKCVLWHPGGDPQMVSLDDQHIRVWDVDLASPSAVVRSQSELESRSLHTFHAGKWNPHQNCNQVATAVDTAVKGWDLRNMEVCWSIENAHQEQVRDVDFNPNKQYYLLTCGDDCSIKFWDIRNTTEPLQTRREHSHWVWCARYNHFHDQLVLSSSSDSHVILSTVPSLSSEPYGHADDDEDETKPKPVLEDRHVATYEEHEDSVYCVEWSVADPWVFASLSYDGRVVISRVPRVEKYRILL
ncbi:EARP and GARP complex-interacting protein 1-like [Corticium candelabrum]|uniref:EARP and GARP complex-interacting protein 1-like n=1 Tax=Corticium candelabrum TaxID=121492 RepID=UPI002E26E28B|nr:EARP and GARP complex-interacting protein 1-like [Corticium candelabrum]